MSQELDRATPFFSTTTASTSAFIQQGPTTGITYYVSDISASVSNAGTVSILGGSTGSVVLWQLAIGTAPIVASFQIPPRSNISGTLTVFVEGGGVCRLNAQGYQIP